MRASNHTAGGTMANAHRSTPRPAGGPQCERLWTIREVSEFLAIPVATLHQWRYLGTGPAAFRVGKHLRYDPDAVRTWLAEQCTSPRSA
jgi:predicted DNA-binding transcriptional regulator AlpA